MAVEPAAAWRRMLQTAQAWLDAQASKARQARRTASRLARMCAEAGATRVVLFGSLVTGEWRRGDIDLAVEGLPGEAFFPLLGTLLIEALPFSVDLVAIEDAPAPLRDRIESEGEVLVDRR